MRNATADSGIRIPCASVQAFFEQWFTILRPIHKLANTEIRLLSTIARYRYEYSLKISDPDTLDSYLMSRETKQRIRKECKMSQSSFQVSFGKLKKKGVIVDGRINQKLIPRFDGDNYKLLLFFTIDRQGNGVEQVQ